MLKSAARDLQRLRRMTQIIGKYGYEEFVKKTNDLPEDLATSDFRPAGEEAKATGSAPRRFRLMLEELGPTFIKLGQVLSARPDLVAPAYVEELKHLQDDCEALPFETIRQTLTEELEKDISELFQSVDETPLATASIAQVHRGVTISGEQVVIKVQRPGIVKQVRSDLDILYRLARLLDAVFEESRMAEPVGVVQEFDKAFTEELNFQHEAANIREFAKLHEHRPDIVVPQVYNELSTSAILTMSFLDGVPLSKLPPEADKKAVAVRIVKEAFDEVFIDGVFHADPHPGNLLYLGNGKYGILDFGLVGRLTRQMQETLVVLALAIAVRDADTVARTLYRLGQADERVDISAVRDDTVAVFGDYLNRRITDVDSQALTRELLSLAMKHRIRIPPEYTMLARAGATIEGIVREFHPDLDVAEVAKPYAEQLLMDRVAPDNMQGGLYKALLQFQGLSQDVPIQVSQILSDLSSGKFSVNINSRAVDKFTNSLMTAATTIAAAIIGGAFVIGSFIGLARVEWTIGGVPIVGVIGATVGLLVFSWLSAYVILRPRIKKISLLRLFEKKR